MMARLLVRVMLVKRKGQDELMAMKTLRKALSVLAQARWLGGVGPIASCAGGRGASNGRGPWAVEGGEEAGDEVRIELFEVVFIHGASVRVTEVITTGVYGSSFPSVSTAAMASTTSRPSTTTPKTAYPGLLAS